MTSQPAVERFHVTDDSITDDPQNGCAIPGRDSLFISGATSHTIHAFRSGAGWDDGDHGGWTLKMLAFDPHGKMWCVGTGSNVGWWDGSQWRRQDEMSTWTLKTLAFDPHGTMWCVGTRSNVGRWDGHKWQDQGEMSKWTLKMLAFDPHGTMWCVGTGSNIGVWNGHDWDRRGEYNLHDWWLESIAFDAEGALWGIMTDGTVARWGSAAQRWEAMGELLRGGWRPRWLTFHGTERWCVDTDARIGKWNDVQHISRELISAYEIEPNQQHAIHGSAPAGLYTLSVHHDGHRRGTNGTLNVGQPSR